MVTAVGKLTTLDGLKVEEDIIASIWVSKILNEV